MSAPDIPSLGAGLVVAERPRSIVSVTARRGRADALAGAIRDGFALDLLGPGRFVAGDTLIATWIQPDTWLLEGEPAAPGVLFGRIAEAVGDMASLVDQSHGRSLLRLTGPATRAVLATSCRLDLHPRVFAPGSAAATRVAHVACVLRADAASLDLLVGSTYAQWLIEDLLEASVADGGRFVPATPPHRSAMPGAGAAR